MNSALLSDYIGKTYERLTVVGYNDLSKKLICLCECGNKTEISKYYFGITKSCGCLKHDFRYKHGDGGTRLYSIWKQMRYRCNKEKSHNYKRYGAKGIKVCNEWNDFLAFKEWALKNGYDEKALRGECTLDRIDPYGDYEPLNCRWISIQKQQFNKTTNIFITYDGRTQTLKEWAKELNISYGTLYQRIKVKKMSIYEAFTIPINEKYSHKRGVKNESINS